jgi:hypothetical protein
VARLGRASNGVASAKAFIASVKPKPSSMALLMCPSANAQLLLCERPSHLNDFDKVELNTEWIETNLPMVNWSAPPALHPHPQPLPAGELRWVDIDFDHGTVSPTIPRVVVDHQVHDSPG